MKALTYYLIAPVVFLISRLPFAILYRISNGVFYIIYYIVKYRRKVVRTNLVNSFPEKSLTEIIQIEIRFYLFFTDFMVESVKYLTISESEIKKRIRFEDEALARDLFQKNKSIIAVLGHFGNWEWAAPAFSLLKLHQLFVIYKQLSNPKFDDLMHKTRSIFGTKLIEMKNVVREMVKNRTSINATIFVSDQTPFPDDAVWTTFLHQDTAVFRGAETMARKMNLPIVFVSVRREKRGYYLVHTELLCENPIDTLRGEISKLHTAKLESEIMLQPEIWLWSHKRWKHRKPVKNQ